MSAIEPCETCGYSDLMPWCNHQCASQVAVRGAKREEPCAYHETDTRDEAPTSVRGIVRRFLEDNGYDGLVNPMVECSCPLDDLVPCEWLNENDCKAAYRIECEGCDEGPCHSLYRRSECRLSDEDA